MKPTATTTIALAVALSAGPLAPVDRAASIRNYRTEPLAGGFAQ